MSIETAIVNLTDAVNNLAAAVRQTDTPKADTPKADTPKAEAPKAETPKAETPKAEKPKAEKPKAETPKAETSAEDTIDFETFRKKAIEFNKLQKGDKKKLLEIMESVAGKPVASVPDFPKEKYADIVAALNSAIEETQMFG